MPRATGERYPAAFDVPSSSGTKTYRISYDAAPGAGYWVCSCPAGINRGNCKHLFERGLRGRAEGKQPLVAPQRVAAVAAPRSKPGAASAGPKPTTATRRFASHNDEV